MKNTLKNLRFSFIYESQIRSLYEIFSRKANEEGFYAISDFFEDSAQQKKQHANWSYKMLQKIKKNNNLIGSFMEFEAIPALGTTSENLETALRIQDREWRVLFSEFSNAAKQEGLDEISSRFAFISEREKKTYEMLKILISSFDDNTFLKKERITLWECQGCGFQIAMETLPEDYICPSCGQLKSYFQKKYLSLSQEEKIIWKCMECGEEVTIKELPDNWKCISCGKPKSYFKRKPLISSDDQKPSYSIKSSPEAFWRCPLCGNKTLIDLPSDFKCPNCGYETD